MVSSICDSTKHNGLITITIINVRLQLSEDAKKSNAKDAVAAVNFLEEMDNYPKLALAKHLKVQLDLKVGKTERQKAGDKKELEGKEKAEGKDDGQREESVNEEEEREGDGEESGDYEEEGARKEKTQLEKAQIEEGEEKVEGEKNEEGEGKDKDEGEVRERNGEQEEEIGDKVESMEGVEEPFSAQTDQSIGYPEVKTRILKTKIKIFFSQFTSMINFIIILC